MASEKNRRRHIILPDGDKPGWTTLEKPDGKLNYAGIMAYRRNHYERHAAPSVRVFDGFERQVQEYLELNHPGEHVFIRVERPHKKAHSKLWEWHFGEMKHGISAKSWLEDKLRNQFGYTKKETKQLFDELTTVTVKQDEEGRIEINNE